MLEKLDPIDYFLYDNTTSSAQGRDWGIKAATGIILSNRKDLRNKFFNYCRMTFGTSPSELSGFSHTIGGFFKQDPDCYRYVLCVTIETKDHKDRNSLAIVGMLFTGKDSLALFLENYDPILTAQNLFIEKTLPEKLEPVRKSNQIILSSNALFNEWQQMGENAVRLERFDKVQSSRLTIDLLINCIKNNIKLPSILGISSRLKKDELSDSDFDIIFCHEGNQKQGLELPKIIRKKFKVTTYKEDERATRKKSKKKIPSLLKFIFWLFAIFLVIFIVYRLSTFNVPDESKETREETVSTQSTHIDTSNEQPTHEESTTGFESYKDGDYLRHVQNLLGQLEALDASDLKETFAYKVIQEVDVLENFEEKREELREIIENTLPDLRERLLNLNLRYYFEEKIQQELPEEKRAEIIRSKIEELNREQNASNQLKNAYHKLEESFGIEFRSNKGTLSRWCEFLREFYEKK